MQGKLTRLATELRHIAGEIELYDKGVVSNEPSDDGEIVSTIEKIDYIIEHSSPSFDYTFFSSVRDKILKFGAPTPKQREAVDKQYERSVSYVNNRR